MSDQINDGGPAFPQQKGVVLGERAVVESSGGMSLRDYFAIRAPEATEEWLKAEAEKDRLDNIHGDSYKPRRRSLMELRADWRYGYADALIAARKKSAGAR